MQDQTLDNAVMKLEPEMPVAIVLLPDEKVTAFYSQKSEARLLQKLQEIANASTLSDVDAAKAWLGTLREPSGWFDTLREADVHFREISGMWISGTSREPLIRPSSGAGA